MDPAALLAHHLADHLRLVSGSGVARETAWFREDTRVPVLARPVPMGHGSRSDADHLPPNRSPHRSHLAALLARCARGDLPGDVHRGMAAS